MDGFDFTAAFMAAYSEATEEKKPDKKESKKKDSSKSKAGKSRKRDVSKGVKLFTLLGEPVEISRDKFSADQVEDAEVLDVFIQESGFEEYLGGRLSQIAEDVPNEFFVSLPSGSKVSSLSTGQYKLCFAGQVDEFEVSDSMTLNELREKFRSMLPDLKADLDFIKGGKLGDAQLLFPEWDKSKAVTEVKLPVTVRCIGREAFVIDAVSDTSKVDEEDDEDDSDSETNEAENTGKVSVKDLEEQIVAKFKEAKDRFLLFETTKDGEYLLVPSNFLTSNGSSTPAKKEPKFSTSSMLSIGYAEFQLEPAMFDGKEEVVAKELFAFLRKNGHIQFSDEKSEAEYVKEAKTIYVQRNGSRKGAFIPKPVRVELERIKGGIRQNVPFCYDRAQLLLSANNVGLFAMTGRPKEGYFEMQVPKIPGGILKQCIELFRYMAFQYDESCRYEVTCQIYYDKERSAYEVYVPEQFVAPITCRVLKKRPAEECAGKILVMDFHSHHIMAPRPSSIDNEDEIGCQLYAICGDMRKDGDMAYALYVRAGAFGKWLELSADTVFEEPEVMPMRDARPGEEVLEKIRTTLS